MHKANHRNWHSVENRFETERSRFDFERLCFQQDGEDDIHDGIERTTATEWGSINSSQEFACALNLAPSQRFSQLATAEKGRSSRFGGGSSFKNMNHLNSSSDGGSGNSVVEAISEDETPQKLEEGSRFLDKLAMHEVALIGRDKELKVLEELFDSTLEAGNGNHPAKMCVVVGPSGSGKSALALEIKTKVVRKGGLWCSGKFDVQNRADPYEAVAQALTMLVRYAEERTELQKEWREAIQKNLGEEMEILAQLVPSLSLLLPPGKPRDYSRGEKTSNGDRQDCGITERATRIQNVLVEFLGLVSTEEHPVTVLLDDIQWASPAALAILEALLLERNLPYFFVLTTCRQEYLEPLTDMEQEDPSGSSELNGLKRSLSSPEIKRNVPLLNLLQKHATRVHPMTIECLDVASVQRVINILLRLDGNASETESLSEIVHHKTQGNPFFLLQFMNVLADGGLLTFDWQRMKWDWLDGEIKHQSVSENVADVVMKRLSNLQYQDLLILQVASCLGNTFEIDTLEFVLLGLQTRYETEWSDIDWPDGDALEARVQFLSSTTGILEKQMEFGKYDFAHDQIQAAAFRLIPTDRKDPMRSSIGKRLIEGLDENNRDHFLFTAVELCAIGLGTMTTADRRNVSFWAFLAGDAALKQGAFDTALRFFEKAIKCLGDDGSFAADPELGLPLFSGAAEAAYCTGCPDVERYIQTIRNADIPETEKIRVLLIRLKVLSAKRDFEGCAEVFRRTVKELGVANLPKSPGVLRALFEFGKTARELRKHSSTTLLALPVCQNPNVRRALSAETASFYQLYLSNPNLCLIATCKAMQWTLEFGHTKSTPSVVVQYATLLVGISKDYRKALELGETSLELIETHGYKAALPMTVGLVFGFIRHWTKPMQEFLSPMRYAIDVGTRLGCADDVSFLSNTYGLLLILTQTNHLCSSIEEIEGFRHKMIETNHSDHLSFTECNLQFALKMATVGQEECSLNGDIMEEDTMLGIATKNNDIALTCFVYYFKMMLNVYFGSPIIAARCGERTIECGFKYAQGAHMVPRNSFFVGLSSILAYKVDKKKQRLKTAKSMEKRLKNWVKSSNPNVLHFLHLLQAELMYVKGQFHAAQGAFTEATKTSMRTGFKLDSALSNELFACFYADAANPMWDFSQARFYMECAVRAYSSYGAMNKVKHMERTYADLLPAP